MKKKLASTVIACSVAVTQISDIAVFADSSIKEVISSEKNTKKETKILDNSNKNKVVDIKDNTLKSLINKTISSSRPMYGDITVGDLEGLTRLTCSNSGDSPASLDGLEYAINLEVIDLPFSKVTDFTPIQNLSKLTEISFDSSRANERKGIIDFDLDFLSNFPNLRIFSLRGSYLTNLTNSGNYKGSENLALDIRSSKITNIDLFRGWTLRRFSVSDTDIFDFRPISDMKIDNLSMDQSYIKIPVQGENNITTFTNPFKDSEGNIIKPYKIGLGGSYNEENNTITIDTTNISSDRHPIEYRIQMKYTSPDGSEKKEWMYFYVAPVVYEDINPKIEGAEDVVIPCDKESFDLMDGVIAKDIEGLGIVDLVIESGSINFGVEGDNKIIYKATDRWGNTTIKERTITVRGSVPVISGADNKQIELGAEFNPLDGVSVTDKDDTNPPTIEVEGKVNTNVEGKYILTYRATDSEGNITEVKREITVVDSRDKNKIVEIPDAGFKKLINYTLNPKRPSNQNITLGEMKSITTLSTESGTGYNIKSIKGIEEAKNLVNLEIVRQSISNISEIENLVKLENVSFERNKLDSIDFKIIENLPKIKTFNIGYNQIRTLKNSSDFNGKKDLTLVIYSNPIRDISPLENWTLKYLNMGYTNVIDFRPIGTMKLDSLNVASPLMKFPKVLRTGNEVRFSNTVYDSEGNLMIPKNIEGGRYDSATNEIILENVTEDGTRKLEYSGSIKYTTVGGSKYQAVSTLKGNIEIASDISPIIDGIHSTYAKQGETFNSLKGVRAIDKDGYDIDIISVNGNLNVDEIGDYTLTYTASDIYGNTKSEDREVKVRPMVRGINIHGQEEDILIETHLYNHPNSGKVIKLKGYVKQNGC